MIPLLYRHTQFDPSHMGRGPLIDAISCVVTEERNGVYELEMKYPVTGRIFNEIQVKDIIYAQPYLNGPLQIFDIYEISRPLNGIVTIYASHVSYRLRHIPLKPFSAQGVQAVFQAIPNNVLLPCPFTFSTNRTGTSVYNLRYPGSVRGKLQGDQWSVLQQYGGEYEWDNFDVRLLTARGRDNGVSISYGKNLTGLKADESILDVVSGILPYWYGFVGEEEELKILSPDPIIWSSNASYFNPRRVACVDLTEYFDTKPTDSNLRARANVYMEDNNIGWPKVSLDVSFVMLSQTEDYKDKLFLDSVNLCDWVTVDFPELGVSTKEKIYRTKWNVLLDRYDSVTIGSIGTGSLASTIVSQSAAIAGNVDYSSSLIQQSAKSIVVDKLISVSSDRKKRTVIQGGDFKFEMQNPATTTTDFLERVKIADNADAEPEIDLIYDIGLSGQTATKIKPNSLEVGASTVAPNIPYTGKISTRDFSGYSYEIGLKRSSGAVNTTPDIKAVERDITFSVNNLLTQPINGKFSPDHSVTDVNNTELWGQAWCAAANVANLPTTSGYYRVVFFGMVQQAFQFGSNGVTAVYSRLYANNQWYPWQKTGQAI